MVNKHYYVIGSVAFIQHPHLGDENVWYRTDACVPFVGCQQCKAKPGELCKGAYKDGVSSCHFVRRDEYKDMQRKTFQRNRERIIHIAEEK